MRRLETALLLAFYLAGWVKSMALGRTGPFPPGS